MLTRCGEVYRPAGCPAASSTASRNAEVEPLPLDPATTTEGNERCGFPSRASARRIGPRPNFHPKRCWRCRNDSASTKRMAAFYVGYNRCAMRTDASPKKNRLRPALAAVAWLLCALPPAGGAGTRRGPAVRRRDHREPLVAGRVRLQGRRPGPGAAPVRDGPLDRRATRPQLELRGRRALRPGGPHPGARGVPQGLRARPGRRARLQQHRHRPGASRGLRGRRGASYARAALIDPSYPVTQRNLGILLSRRLGDPEAARRAWQRYLELAPAGEYADEIRRELAADPPPTAR